MCWMATTSARSRRTIYGDSLEGQFGNGGEGGIRTPGRGLSPYDGLANRCFRPLSHLSAKMPSQKCFPNVNTQMGRIESEDMDDGIYVPTELESSYVHP